MNIIDAVKGAFSSLGVGSNDKAQVTEENKENTETQDSKGEVDESKVPDDDSGKPDEKPAEKSKVEEPKIDDKTAKALKLFDLISSPETAGATLTNLIEQAKVAGVLGEGTKAEKEAVKEDLQVELKKLVKEEDAFLIDTLGPVIEYLINKISKDQEINNTTLRKKLEEYESQTEAQKFETRLGSIISNKKYEGYLEDMNEIMQEFPPSDNIDLEDYIERTYKIAQKTGKPKSQNSQKKAEEKTERNIADHIPSSSNGKVDEYGVISMNRRPTLAEATKAAAEKKRLIVNT
jgi:hypothetical protein